MLFPRILAIGANKFRMRKIREVLPCQMLKYGPVQALYRETQSEGPPDGEIGTRWRYRETLVPHKWMTLSLILLLPHGSQIGFYRWPGYAVACHKFLRRNFCTELAFGVPINFQKTINGYQDFQQVY